MGMENLEKPWVPNFKGIPAEITDPAVSASTWASGNRIWTGTIGTFTGKEAKKASRSKIWRHSLNSVVNNICESVVPVWKKINKIAKSVKTDPSRVCKKNWYAACIFLCLEPHTPIIIGESRIGPPLYRRRSRKGSGRYPIPSQRTVRDTLASYGSVSR